MLAKRHPDAVRALEELQQQERGSAGEPPLNEEDFRRLARQDIQQELVSSLLETKGMLAAAEAAADDERVDRILAGRLKEWGLDDPAQWSRYETPSARFGIARACARIEAVFARCGWVLPQVPAVGTLTTGQMSARMQRSPGGAPVILIDNGFFRFAGIMSRLSVFARHDANVQRQLSAFTIQYLSDLAGAHAVLRTCFHVYPRKTPPEYERLVAVGAESFITFVISHEYAHLAAGDLDSDRDLRTQEFEADKVGFVTAMEAAEEDQDSAVIGPFLYLAGLDVLDRALATYDGHDEPSPDSASPADYPTPFERMQNLLSWLEDTPYVPRYVDHLRTASACYHLILMAWDYVRPGLRDAREELSVLQANVLHPDAATFAVTQRLWMHVQRSADRP